MDVSGGPDEAVSGVNDDVQRVQDRAEQLGVLAASSARVRGAAVSRGRDLVVEVDASGRVTKLQIANQALSRGGTRIGSELMDLLRLAHQDAQAQVLHAATALLGEDPVLDMLRPEAVEDQGLGAPGVWGVDAPRLGVSPKSGGLW